MGYATPLGGSLANVDVKTLVEMDLNLVNDFGSSSDASFGVGNEERELVAGETAQLIIGEDDSINADVLGVGTFSSANITLLGGLVEIQLKPVNVELLAGDGQNYIVSNNPLDAENLTASATVMGIPTVNASLDDLTGFVNSALGMLGQITVNDILNAVVFDLSIDPSGVFPVDDAFFICFVRGTLINTADGAAAVEGLKVGDLVMTKDHGLQPIRWIGSRKLSMITLRQQPELRPVRIEAAALGSNTPSDDLVVSPQHRILVRSRIAQKMFGTNEVLVAAKQLTLLDGIDIAHDMVDVEYFQLMFERHEVVIANGDETESLFTGPEALKAVGAAARKEILEIFLELGKENYQPLAARTLVSGRMGRRMTMRHAQNGKVLVQ